MNDHAEWLHRLGASRPQDARSLTRDILDRAGPPPIPGGPEDRGARFLALHVLPLLADDNHRRAALKAERLEEGAPTSAALDDARAEADFWLHVRDWTRTWVDHPRAAPAPRHLARIPRPRTASA